MILCSFCSKSQQEVDQLIAGPETEEESKAYICNECVDVSHQIIKQQTKKKKSKVKTPKDLTPERIKGYLDQYVIGQQIAKETLSVAVYNHYKRLNNSNSDIRLDKSNILMAGPSGVGKTYLVKTVAQFLELPFAITDATSLTESGYVGDDVESILERLIEHADGDIEKAQNGIIYIDEIDKKVTKIVGGSANRDVSGEGVQQSLLKLVEGSTVKVPTKNYRMTGETFDFDTSNILFIVGGAFVDIEKVIQKDLGIAGGIGFGSTPSENADKVLQHIMPSHLISYGMIPEFVGRFPVLIPMHSLDEDSLVKILTEPKDNLLDQYRLLFEHDDVTLEFSDTYIRSVARECIEQKTGARGLRSVIEKSLLSTQYTLPRLASEGITRIVVSEFDKISYIADKKKEIRAQK